MSTRSRLRNGVLMMSIVVCGLLGVTSCTTHAQLSSPVGVWVAIDDDNGVLTIRQDGTFTVTNASFNPISARDAADDFNASGMWRIFPDEDGVTLNFKDSRHGFVPLQPAGITVPFSSGSIRFQDPDNFYDIEFRIVDETSN